MPEAGPQPGLDMQTEMIMRAPGSPAPTTALGFATVLAHLVDPEILSKGIDCLWVFSFRAEWLEWWRIRGEPPCGVDDVLRNVAQFSSSEAIGVVIPGSAVIPDGSTKRSVNTMVEFAGSRALRALVLDFEPGGKPILLGVLTHENITVQPGQAWLGQVPGHDLQIRTNEVVRVGGGPGVGEG